MLAADSERLFIGDILADDNSDYGAESESSESAQQSRSRLRLEAGVPPPCAESSSFLVAVTLAF